MVLLTSEALSVERAQCKAANATEARLDEEDTRLSTVESKTTRYEHSTYCWQCCLRPGTRNSDEVPVFLAGSLRYVCRRLRNQVAPVEISMLDIHTVTQLLKSS